MEYYLARAMEIARLLPDEVRRLHEHEKRLREMIEFDPMTQTCKGFADRKVRCLMPFEIQFCFHLNTLKERWRIPFDDGAQIRHAHRIRMELLALRIAPSKDFGVLSPEVIHPFDFQVIEAVKEKKINFYCAESSRRERKSDDLFED